MAKPILVARFPNEFSGSFDKIQKAIRKQMNEEYHVLMIAQDIDEIKFEVLNVDKEPEIKYSELKKLINKEVEVKAD